MRLEASVPSDDLSALRVGRHGGLHRARLRSDVHGHASSASRRRPIRRRGRCRSTWRSRTSGGRLVAGLFAEGRVVSQSATGSSCRSTRSTSTGAEPWVLRVTGGKTERVAVTLGLRDPRTERVQRRVGAERTATRCCAARRRASRRARRAGDANRTLEPEPERSLSLTMFISDTAIKRPVLTVVAMLMLVVFGLVALFQLDTDEYPGDRRAGRRRRDPLSGRVARRRRARGRRADRGGHLRHQRRRPDALELARQLRATSSSSSTSRRTRASPRRRFATRSRASATSCRRRWRSRSSRSSTRPIGRSSR